MCDLQNVLLELELQDFVLYKCLRETSAPAMKFSLLLWMVWKTRSFPGQEFSLLFIHVECHP